LSLKIIFYSISLRHQNLVSVVGNTDGQKVGWFGACGRWSICF